MEKPVVYAPIPEFDQCTQAVFQTAPIDVGDYIKVGVEIRDVAVDEGGGLNGGI